MLKSDVRKSWQDAGLWIFVLMSYDLSLKTCQDEVTMEAEIGFN